MTFEELKNAWHHLDKKMHKARALNEKLIVSMVTERSSSRFQTVKRNYLLGFVWITLCLVAGLAVLLGNPFDYEYKIQFIPMVLYCACLMIMMVNMFLSYGKLDRIRLDQQNIRQALQQIVGVYEQPKRYMKYLLYVFIFSQTVLFPFSFLPKAVERIGLWPALLERLIPITIAIGLLYIAHRLGMFKEKYGDKFRGDLTELEQLKSMASELDEKSTSET